MTTSRTIYQQHRRIQFILRLPLVTAALSFIIGTVILTLYYIEKDSPKTIVNEEVVSTAEEIIYIGLAYVILAFLINMLVLVAMLVCALVYRKYKIPILRNTAVLLVNIPVVVLYIYLFTYIR